MPLNYQPEEPKPTKVGEEYMAPNASPAAPAEYQLGQVQIETIDSDLLEPDAPEPIPPAVPRKSVLMDKFKLEEDTTWT